MAPHTHTIVIIGGGFSGTVLAANLLRNPPPRPTHVVLVERCAELGGAAYAQRDYPYLLNVPAGRMSADSRAPGAFLDFVQRRRPDVSGQDFVPRAWYGEYLRQMLVEAERAAPAHTSFERLQAEVVAISQAEDRRKLRLADGSVLTADDVVLASGNPPPADLPALAALRDHPRYVRDACRDAQRSAIRGDVLLIGTGLTMADAALAVSDNEGTVVHAISRHGLVPPAQTSTSHSPGALSPQAILAGERSVRSLLRMARALARDAEAANADWRDVVNAIRERAPELWRHFDVTERRRFLRHVRAYWDVHRHRLPPATSQRINTLRGVGRLFVHAGRILEVQPQGERLRVTWRPRGEKQAKVLVVDWILNCTGPDYDLRRSPDALFQQAVQSGIVVPDACGLGLRTGAHGALLDASGKAGKGLYCLGPLLRADHWETTAVAELRAHAEALAAHLSSKSQRSRAASPETHPVAARSQAGHMPQREFHTQKRHFEQLVGDANLS